MVSFRGNNEQLCNALRHCADRKSSGVTDVAVFSEAAERIEALEAENARLREALQRLRARYRIYAGWPELRRVGKADKLILALADEVLEPSPALKQEGGE